MKEKLEDGPSAESEVCIEILKEAIQMPNESIEDHFDTDKEAFPQSMEADAIAFLDSKYAKEDSELLTVTEEKKLGSLWATPCICLKMKMASLVNTSRARKNIKQELVKNIKLLCRSYCLGVEAF